MLRYVVTYQPRVPGALQPRRGPCKSKTAEGAQHFKGPNRLSVVWFSFAESSLGDPAWHGDSDWHRV